MEAIGMWFSILGVIIGGYLVIRLWSYGFFKSKYDVEKQVKEKEKQDAKSE